MTKLKGLGFYVYILLSEKDNQFYVGYTSNLYKRFQQHCDGLTKSTRNRRPLKLIFYEAYLYKEDALRREKYFKTSAGKRALKLILNKKLFKIRLNI